MVSFSWPIVGLERSRIKTVEGLQRCRPFCYSLYHEMINLKRCKSVISFYPAGKSFLIKLSKRSIFLSFIFTAIVSIIVDRVSSYLFSLFLGDDQNLTLVMNGINAVLVLTRIVAARKKLTCERLLPMLVLPFTCI